MHCYQRIRDLREDADLTQKQVAELLDMHLTQYRRYESGESELPLYLALNLANLYHVSIDYIAGATDFRYSFTEKQLNSNEIRLVRGFRKLTPLSRGRLLERLDVLLERK